LRTIYAATLFVAVVLIVVGIYMALLPKPPSVIEATVEFQPETFNLDASPLWFNATIILPKGYSVLGINASSVYLENILASMSKIEGETFIANFDGASVRNYLISRIYHLEITVFPVDVTIRVSGDVNGLRFEGSGTVTVTADI